MNLQERIDAMVQLGTYLLEDGEEWQQVKQEAFYRNGWFTSDFVQAAATSIAKNFLQKDLLEKWVNHYHLNDSIIAKNIGVVMAGNIPMVGFHDLLCVFICGHKQTVKLSSKDDFLMKHLVKILVQKNENVAEQIVFADMLKGCDAYIATGGNSAAKAFEEYFGRFPSIIRKNRTTVAILTGTETDEELLALADDIHLYFGLGCRNVTKLYIPHNYNFEPLLHSFKKYLYFADHHKYRNNYDYNLSIILLNNVYYMTNEATLLVENKGLFSPISQVFYEFYDNQADLLSTFKNNHEVQCIVGRDFEAFGTAQNPTLFSYADGVDTMQFLLGL